MNNTPSEKGLFSCQTVSWIVAVVFGIFVYACCYDWAGIAFIISIVFGAIATVAAAWLLANYFCTGKHGVPSELSQTVPPPSQPVAAQPVKSEAAASVGASANIAASSPVHEQEATIETSDISKFSPERKKGAGKGVKGAKKAAKLAEMAANKNKKKEETAPVPEAPKAAEQPKPVEAAGVATEYTPRVFSARPSDVDDLKQIKGVGPGLEKTLNDLGIFSIRSNQRLANGRYRMGGCKTEIQGTDCPGRLDVPGENSGRRWHNRFFA